MPAQMHRAISNESVIAGHSALKTRVNALMTPQVGFTRLAALNAQLGQARVAVQSIRL
jgi:hypothetical protein